MHAWGNISANAGKTKIVWLALLFAGLAVLPLKSQTVSREYDLKAVFLYNLAAFIDWPESVISQSDDPFVIGVIGVNPFGSALDDIVRDERIKGRPILIRHINTKEGAVGCHIIFVSASERREIKSIVRFFRQQPVLSVADSPGFLDAGGMVLLDADTRIRVKVNLGALRAAGLAMSPKLLRLAEVVDMPPSAP